MQNDLLNFAFLIHHMLAGDWIVLLLLQLIRGWCACFCQWYRSDQYQLKNSCELFLSSIFSLNLLAARSHFFKNGFDTLLVDNTHTL